MAKQTKDQYLNVTVNEYKTIEKIGKGKIGVVYKAQHTEIKEDFRACKIIIEGNLKDGYERELKKNALLKRHPNVVQYHNRASGYDHEHRLFACVFFDYIPGVNLKEYIAEHSEKIDMAFIENLLETILRVLHTCTAKKIQHGDLHEGNILIEYPDSDFLNDKEKIWVSDFGYGGSHNKLKPKDDFKQLFSISSALLGKLADADMNPRDKVMYYKMKEFLKKLTDVDHTQGGYVGVPEKLIDELKSLKYAAEIESAAASSGEEIKGIADYLYAEALGYRNDDWKDLFVPEFLAAQDLLNKSITVLTGARGCGKTMTFRRLTAFMDVVIGEPAKVAGAGQFVGFYLNSRDILEAFPWLPTKINKNAEQQIIHFFHLAWLNEALKTLSRCEIVKSNNYDWLDGFLTDVFAKKYYTLPVGADILAHARAFVETEKEICRLANLGRSGGYNKWPLARLDFIDILQRVLKTHVSWIGKKSIYLFLDDYTVPTIQREMQRILNIIIFKRRSDVFFKISTESSNSLERKSTNSKPLEVFHDFHLIDLANVSLHQEGKDKRRLLEKIFQPRIERHPLLKGKNYSLTDVLGKTSMNNNQVAGQMRETPNKNFYYHGIRSFIGMWASDIRTMIQIFSEIIREANGDLKIEKLPISNKIQNKCFKSAGGEFMDYMESVSNPLLMEGKVGAKKEKIKYGSHLKDVVEAFVNVSRFELTKGKLVKNEGRFNPKQAFRLEILDNFNLPDNVLAYYEGLIRWHIFLQDWRGKSVRSMITPRLYLNRVLIPISQLTFSLHDNIQISNMEFVKLLEKPRDFLKYWKDKRKKAEKPKTTSQRDLWEK